MPSRRRPSAAPNFNPQSIDSTLATIISELRSHREESKASFEAVGSRLVSIETQTLKTNGRVSAIERWQESSKAKLAAVAATMGVAGTILAWLGKIVFSRA